jgi:hypothetical protein
MLKLKPVIIFLSIRNGRQRKLMSANAGVMLKLKPEIMGYAAANESGEKQTRNFSMRGGPTSPETQ